jgi:nicotinamide-nucleotide amidase
VAAVEIEVAKLLEKKNVTLGTVESATGGLIADRLTDVAGISGHFKGSIVSYSNEVKIRVVGVKEETIKEFGAVSAQVAEQMAEGGRRVLNVDVCVADTGIAGPKGAVPGKPIGLFYIGLATKDGVSAQMHNFKGNRMENKDSAAQTALLWVKEYLGGLKDAKPDR